MIYFVIKERIVFFKRFLIRFYLHFKFKRIDNNIIDISKNDILLFCVVRNEELRLPYLLHYYKSLGINKFFFIDNNSNDGTRRILLTKEYIYLYSITDNFKNKSIWIDYLLRKYAINHWCIIIDADELIIFPNHEQIDFKKICNNLDVQKVTAMNAILIDMYSKKNFEDVNYESGKDPLLYSPYFDNGPFLKINKDSAIIKPEFTKEGINKGIELVFGGMRNRIFNLNPCVTKFPLFKYNTKIFLSDGTHLIENAIISKTRCAILHFKFLQDFKVRVNTEVKRGQHWNNAIEYKGYKKLISGNSSFSFYDETISIKYLNSKQLIDLGIIITA